MKAILESHKKGFRKRLRNKAKNNSPFFDLSLDRYRYWYYIKSIEGNNADNGRKEKMNRVIKFRGLNANNEFVYGLPSFDAVNSTVYYKEYSQRICWLPESGGCANQPVKNGTLGQFTGLTDKNGVDIYEGDIVEKSYLKPENYNSGEYVRSDIVFHDQSFCERFTHDDGKVYFSKIYGDSVVVGNIHQNAELLK